jgi:hypothetical protein
MLATLQSIKSQFAENATITGLVGTRCSFVIELQEQTTPFIAYNIKEDAPTSKDGSKDLTLIIAVVADSINDLLTIYDACRTVIDNEATGFIRNFEGSSIPDTTDKDDHYIIELNYNLQTF